MTDVRPIIFFDTDCPMCCGWVRFLMAEDSRELFRFAPLGGVTAGRMAGTCRESGLSETVVVATMEDGQWRCRTHTEAILHIMGSLDGIWRCGLLLALVPRALRDGVYRLVARHRHRLGTAPEQSPCRIPDSRRMLP